MTSILEIITTAPTVPAMRACLLLTGAGNPALAIRQKPPRPAMAGTQTSYFIQELRAYPRGAYPDQSGLLGTIEGSCSRDHSGLL